MDNCLDLIFSIEVKNLANKKLYCIIPSEGCWINMILTPTRQFLAEEILWSEIKKALPASTKLEGCNAVTKSLQALQKSRKVLKNVNYKNINLS